jgi:hypothetical protein
MAHPLKIVQAGPPGRARLAGELREMDQDILKLTRSLAVRRPSRSSCSAVMRLR